MHFSEKMLDFLQQLKLPRGLPKGVGVMHPFADEDTRAVCKLFYRKFYGDSFNRWMIIGINPGRFGGGVTGIPFTDPVRLKQNCGIDNPWPQRQELSSVFIYEMIEAFGGPAAFYRHFYITAISPLGFTRNGKNLNYYDDRQLQQYITPFALDCLHKQFTFGIHRDTAFCLGDGKNFRYLSKLNQENKLFDNIIPVAHPRFIMQYRLKMKQEYLDKYITAFHSVLN
jgi:hypothetical protein